MSLARYLSKLGAMLGSDGKVPQAALAANVAGNGPAFSAYTSASQSLSNGVFTLLQFGGEEFDTASCFNNTGGTVNGIPAYAFMPNVEGWYQINAQAYLAVGSQTELALQLAKNGAFVRYLADVIAPSSRMVNGSILVYMNGTTDYLQMYLYTSSVGSTGAVTTCWSGFLTRRN